MPVHACTLSASGRYRIPITSSVSSSSHPAIKEKNAFLELLVSFRTPFLRSDIAWKSLVGRPEEVLRDLLGHQFPNPITNPDQVVDFGT